MSFPVRASCIFRHCFNAAANSGRCRRGLWGRSAFKRRIQCLAFCNRSARVAEKTCRSKAMRSKSMTSLSPILCSANDFRYSSCSYHLECLVGWLPCLPCLLLSQASASPCRTSPVFQRETPCFGPRLEFFLMTKPGIEVKSQLVFWSVVGLRMYFIQISPASARHNPDFRASIAVRTSMFCRILAKFEDLCAVQVDE